MASSSVSEGSGGVSVIIPTYQRARMVCEAIDSALDQSLPPREIIVIDDGSTDDTASVLRKYGDRIRYHYQENRGVSAARNRGLALATGEFIAFLDSDDVWTPEKLEMQLKVLDRLPEIGLLFADFGIRKGNGTVTHSGTSRWFPSGTGYADLYDEVRSCRELGLSVGPSDLDCKVYYGRVFDRMLGLPYGLLSTSVVRRSALQGGIRFSEGTSLYEDWEFFARVAKSSPVGFLDHELVFNRSHRGAERLTLKPNLLKTRCYLDVIERVWKADSEFVSRNALQVRALEANALLVLARDSVLAGDRGAAQDALKRWRSLGTTDRKAEAWIYRKCAASSYGPVLLKYLLRARTLFRIATGSIRKGRYSCAPS